MRLQSLLSSRSLWAAVSILLRLGASLLVLPLALRSIPAAEMGLYYTFLALSGFGLMLDLGMVDTIGRSAAYAWSGITKFEKVGVPAVSVTGEPNYLLLVKLTVIIKKWYTVAAWILFLLLATFGSWFLDHKIEESHLPSNLMVCWLLYAAGASLNFGMSFWGAMLTGVGEVNKVSKYTILSQLLGVMILAVCLLLGWGIWSYTVFLLISPLPLRVLAKKSFLEKIRYQPVKVDLSEGRSILETLFPMTWRQGLLVASRCINDKAISLVVVTVLGLALSSSYGLTAYLIVVAAQIAAMPLRVAIPEITSAMVAREYTKVRRVFFLRTYAGVGLLLLGGAVIAMIGAPLLSVIGSKTELLDTFPLMLLLLGYLLEFHQEQYCRLVNAANKNPFWCVLLIVSVISVGVVYVAGLRWGLMGILVSRLLCGIAVLYWWPVKQGVKELNEDRDYSVI